jgi:hypothetical protein
MKTVNVPNARGGDESAAPEPIVIKHFTPKKGLEKGLRRC